KGVGTVDYYVKPDKRDTSRYKGARTGTGYAGLRFQSDYKEYMYVKLDGTLEKGKVYHFKMYIRLLESNNVTVTVKQLGAYFSPEEFHVGMEFQEEGLVDTTYNKGISGTLNWILIQGDYTARGNEQYIIIGNFRTKMKDDFVKKNKWSLFEFKEAYYYIDDLSLTKKAEPVDSAAIKNGTAYDRTWLPESFDAGQKFTMKNLQFQGNTATIMESSFKMLDDFVKVLNEHPQMEIEIDGHTDKFNDETAEHKLSKDRAKAVVDYLKAHGVTNQLAFKGYGSTQPIAPNDSEIYKAKNRRVEVVIIKN
ncbi:MAG: OmpA family protein, partial [Bacteroidia bacterium]